MGKIRKNASADTLMQYFKDAISDRGGTFYPNPAFDTLNFKQCLKYYEPQLIADLIDIYVYRTAGKWRVQDFVNKIPDLAEWLEKDQKAHEERRKLLQQTRDRMKGAGLL